MGRDPRSLRGIHALRVVVEDLSSAVEQAGLHRTDIQTDVELKLRLAGIKVLPEDAQPLSPYLYVNANVQWQLERNPLYRFSPHEKEDFLTQEIRTLMAEFGAEVYSVPPEFAERAGHYIELYQGPDRPLVAKVLNGSAGQLAVMRQILREERLPVDLAYIPLVESALASDKPSPAGALGPWQLTPVTARAFGLRVDKQIDERTNLAKSTRASCRFLRNLILDFGAGSSVMLALAAYNLGPSRVKQAIMDTVRDPIKQRDFWYLYRANALPRETREYVPKVVAAMIVGRNPQHFGF
jgi:membrane-bound lytic murein transglycosylase D